MANESNNFWCRVYGKAVLYGHCKMGGGGVDIVAFSDNKYGEIGDNIESIPIISPQKINEFGYDKIIVMVEDSDHLAEITEQLKVLGVDINDIDTQSRCVYLSELSCYPENTDTRVKWLNDFANYVHSHRIPGNVCECGVFRGDFAAYINKYFYDRTLYLFDTFTGFTKESIDVEYKYGERGFVDGKFWERYHLYENTSITLVMNKMLYKKNCVIKQGFFPLSATDINDTFCFVNLDMDLYNPMFEALHFFWDKMAVGGVILLHDYFAVELPGVARAVADFEKDLRECVCKIPIGDASSIAIIKK